MKSNRLRKTLTTCLISAILLSLSVFSVPSYALTEGDWTYTVTDGKATVTACALTSGNIVIPATLGGYPVTALKNEGLFYNKENITGVTIPYGVTRIPQHTFRECYGLESVTIPNSVTDIAYDAFNYCTHLYSLKIPNSVISIGENAFLSCYNLPTITIPDSVTSIGYGAFTATKLQLRTADFGSGITYIPDKCFYMNDSVKKVICRGNAPAIAADAFDTSLIPNMTIYYDPSTTGWPAGNTYTSNGITYKIAPMSVIIPRNLSAVGGKNKVDLTWDAVQGANSYTVRYSKSSNMSSPTTANFTNNSASVEGLLSNTVYYFEVRANSASGSSEYSGAARGKTDINAPAIPANLSAFGGQNKVDLTWDAATGADSYTVKYSTAPDLSSPTTADFTTNSASITGLPSSTTYYFAVCANNVGGSSDYSGTVNATTYADNATFTINPPLRVEDYTAPGGTTYHLIRGLEPNGASVSTVMSTYFSITDGSWILYSFTPATGAYTEVNQIDTVTKVGSCFKIEIYNAANTLTNTYYIAILGDVTCDGLINVQDTSALKNHINGISTITNDIRYYCGDVVANTPKLINVQDTSAVKKHITGIASITQ